MDGTSVEIAERYAAWALLLQLHEGLLQVAALVVLPVPVTNTDLPDGPYGVCEGERLPHTLRDVVQYPAGEALGSRPAGIELLDLRAHLLGRPVLLAAKDVAHHVDVENLLDRLPGHIEGRKRKRMIGRPESLDRLRMDQVLESRCERSDLAKT